MSETSSETPRSAERLMTILDALSKAPIYGLRLKDVVEATGLGKTTAHRFLNGLADHGLIDFDEDTGRFFMGIKMLAWASAARNRFNLAKITEPILASLARRSEDTVYLIGRCGDDAVCLDCQHGAFPIKVLFLSIGDRRPLGIGAGSLALLAALPDNEVERILLQQTAKRSAYAFDDTRLREMINSTRQSGYAYCDVHFYKDMGETIGIAAVAVAIRRSDGAPVAALHVTSITSRLAHPRRESIVSILLAEREKLEEELRPIFDAPISQSRASLA